MTIKSKNPYLRYEFVEREEQWERQCGEWEWEAMWCEKCESYGWVRQWVSEGCEAKCYGWESKGWVVTDALCL